MIQRRVIAVLCTLWFAPLCQAGLFDNREQQAGKLFEQGDYEAAAEKFTDSYRRGVAEYRAGKYGQAAESFELVQRESVKTDALYNLGNSRFQQARLEDAAEAYRQVLLREPEHEDARHNLGLTSAMLAEANREEQEQEEKRERTEEKKAEKEQKEQEQKKQEQKEQEKKDQGEEQDEQEQSGEEESEQQQSAGKQQDEEQQSGEEQSEQEQSAGKQQQDEEQQSGDEQSEQEQSAGKQQQDEEQQSGDEQSEQERSAGKQQQDEEQRSSDMDTLEQQQEGAGGDTEQADVSGQHRSAEKPDDDEPTEETAQATNDVGSGDRQSDRGNDEPSQDQRNALGDDPAMDDRSAEEQAGGGEQDEKMPGSDSEDPRERQAGRANDPRDFDPASASMDLGAIEQFDQLGQQTDTEGENAPRPGDIPGGGGRSAILMMEQLLDQVEGDPAQLMRNQFMLEEQRMNLDSGGMYEPRPW